LRRHYAAIRGAGADLLGVGFDTPERTRVYVAQQALPFPFALDPERAIYEAYGLSRGSLTQVYSAGALGKAAGLALGRPSAVAGFVAGMAQDNRQLGGDFVISPEGALLYAHAALDAGDALDARTLLRLLSMVRRAPAAP
jgi:hypothetical protein